jgi:hypothetical protein
MLVNVVILKARIVEGVKVVSGEWHGKHVSTAANSDPTVDGAVFSMPGLYTEEQPWLALLGPTV